MADARKLPKRFYKIVAISDDNRVLLDDRVIKTPMKASLVLPNRALAEAVAEEWKAQGEFINPVSMKMTKLANTAIDRVATERIKIQGEIVQYAGSDLVCYRALSPERLVRRQAEIWDPVIAFVNERLGVSFTATSGVVHSQQKPETLLIFGKHVARFDAFKLVAFHHAMAQTGSALLTCMMLEHAIDRDAAWHVAMLDEEYQSEEWGRDDEADMRRANQKAEFDAAVKFAGLV
jgi:chaperone required for assembly of F1-ATPase